MRFVPLVCRGRVIPLLVSCAVMSWLPAQACAPSSTGAIPLVDLGIGTYRGFLGGLYRGGSNAMPPAHAILGQTAVAAVQPVDGTGQPSANGRIVIASIGMSNASQEFSAWKRISDADPLRLPAVRVIDLAQPGRGAPELANPGSVYWTVALQRLAQAGLTAAQVQVVWLKQAVPNPTTTFPANAAELQGYLESIARNISAVFPRCQIAFVSSRTYAGYANSHLNPEPHAYESGFAVRGLIEQQIGGDPGLAFDPRPGRGMAPWLAWGPYPWADGTTPRGDGLTWTCCEFRGDGTHPNLNGERKVAEMLDAHFRASPFAAPYYGGGGSDPGAAAVLPYGDCCIGSRGPLDLRVDELPRLGVARLALRVRNAVAGQPVVGLLSAAPAGIAFEGCTLWVDPAGLLIAAQRTANSAGDAQLVVAVPNLPVLAGASVYLQWVARDPAAAGLASIGGGLASFGVELRLGH